MEYPSKHVKKNFSKVYSENKVLLIDIFQKADAWITWFIGFSIGGLALLAGNLDKFTNRLSQDQIHIILVNLFISTVSGVLFRYVYLWFYLFLMKVYERISSDFETDFELPTYLRLRGDESFAELVIVVNSFTGENFSNLIMPYIEADPEKKKIIYDTLVDYYHQTNMFNEFEKGKAGEYLKERLETYFGKPIETIRGENRLKRLYGCKYYMLIVFGSVFLIAFTVSFIVALYTFCFGIHI